MMGWCSSCHWLAFRLTKCNRCKEMFCARTRCHGEWVLPPGGTMSFLGAFWRSQSPVCKPCEVEMTRLKREALEGAEKPQEDEIDAPGVVGPVECWTDRMIVFLIIAVLMPVGIFIGGTRLEEKLQDFMERKPK